MTDLKNKTILITGSTGGFGIQLVRSFLREGSQLILTDLKIDLLEKQVRELSGYGTGKILGYFSGDLSNEVGCMDVISGTKNFAEVPDIIINNAGIAVYGYFHNVPSQKLEMIMSINAIAPMRITHAFLAGMVERKSGHIINISSIAGLLAAPGLAAYSTSKFAIRAFGEAIHKEVSGYGVNVTNVYPFFTKTPILQSEQIGQGKLKVPEIFLSETVDVIEEIVAGVKNNQLHVYPGKISKSIELLGRFAPWVMDAFSGNLPR